MIKKILYTLLALVLLVPAGLYFAGLPPFAPAAGEEGAEGEGAEVAVVPHYLTLDPPFIVNFMHRGSLRYLQLSLDLMYHDELMIEQIKTQMPEIRNDLILLFSNQDFEMLNTLEGKEKLREEVLLAVNNALEIDPANPGPASEGQVYFTNFVMQ